jgi:hypothetical protein
MDFAIGDVHPLIWLPTIVSTPSAYTSFYNQEQYNLQDGGKKGRINREAKDRHVQREQSCQAHCTRPNESKALESCEHDIYH